MVTKEHLEIAKNELLKLCEKKEKVIIEGSRPLLLVANYIDDITPGKIKYLSKITNDKYTFATLVYLLSKITRCHAVINYINVDQGVTDFDLFLDTERKVNAESIINDPVMREYILDNNINALLSHKLIYKAPHHRDIDIFEHNSSFNFGGRTGFAQLLDQAAQNNGLTTQLGFTTTPLVTELYEHGYKFTDEVVEHNKCFSLGILLNRPLERAEMWPRTLEVIGSTDLTDNPDKLVTLSNAEKELIDKALNDLDENGLYKALVYKK